MSQLTFEGIISPNKKRVHYKNPSYKKKDSIYDLVTEKNPETHIYRYRTLYKIYNLLYILTYSKPLSNLVYYVEDDGFLLAEIKDSGKLFLPERIKMHIDLLRKVKKNSEDLEYTSTPLTITEDTNGQISLFQSI